MYRREFGGKSLFHLFEVVVWPVLFSFCSFVEHCCCPFLYCIYRYVILFMLLDVKGLSCPGKFLNKVE